MTQQVKNPPAMQETQGMWFQSLGQEDTLQEEMATQSSILAWKIPWTEDPSGLQSTESQRVGHDWVTSLSLSSILAWRIPGTEEPGGLPYMGLHRVRHDWRDLAAATVAARNFSSSVHCLGFRLFIFGKDTTEAHLYRFPYIFSYFHRLGLKKWNYRWRFWTLEGSYY